MKGINTKAINLPRCHWNKQHGRHIRAKRQFNSLQDAVDYINNRNLQNRYDAYKCKVCKKWHIGHKPENL